MGGGVLWVVGCYGWWGAMGGGMLWVVGCYEWWSVMGGGVLWVVGFYVNHVPLSLIRNLLAYNLKITFPCYSLRLIIRSQ